jgi:hypothetical protein
MAASSPHPSPPKEEREIESSAGGSVKMRPKAEFKGGGRLGRAGDAGKKAGGQEKGARITGQDKKPSGAVAQEGSSREHVHADTLAVVEAADLSRLCTY